MKVISPMSEKPRLVAQSDTVNFLGGRNIFEIDGDDIRKLSKIKSKEGSTKKGIFSTWKMDYKVVIGNEECKITIKVKYRVVENSLGEACCGFFGGHYNLYFEDKDGSTQIPLVIHYNNGKEIKNTYITRFRFATLMQYGTASSIIRRTQSLFDINKLFSTTVEKYLPGEVHGAADDRITVISRLIAEDEPEYIGVWRPVNRESESQKEIQSMRYRVYLRPTRAYGAGHIPFCDMGYFCNDDDDCLLMYNTSHLFSNRYFFLMDSPRNQGAPWFRLSAFPDAVSFHMNKMAVSAISSNEGFAMANINLGNKVIPVDLNQIKDSLETGVLPNHVFIAGIL